MDCLCSRALGLSLGVADGRPLASPSGGAAHAAWVPAQVWPVSPAGFAMAPSVIARKRFGLVRGPCGGEGSSMSIASCAWTDGCAGFSIEGYEKDDASELSTVYGVGGLLPSEPRRPLRERCALPAEQGPPATALSLWSMDGVRGSERDRAGAAAITLQHA